MMVFRSLSGELQSRLGEAQSTAHTERASDGGFLRTDKGESLLVLQTHVSLCDGVAISREGTQTHSHLLNNVNVGMCAELL